MGRSHRKSIEGRAVIDQYDADYFMRGKQTGKSLYEDYHWMPQLTTRMVRVIVEHLGITSGDKILDFGCARGYLVKAFRLMGYCSWGLDISQWAIENCDPDVKGWVGLIGDESKRDAPDWIIAKDVLEHVKCLDGTIRELTYS